MSHTGWIRSEQTPDPIFLQRAKSLSLCDFQFSLEFLYRVVQDYFLTDLIRSVTLWQSEDGTHYRAIVNGEHQTCTTIFLSDKGLWSRNDVIPEIRVDDSGEVTWTNFYRDDVLTKSTDGVYRLQTFNYNIYTLGAMQSSAPLDKKFLAVDLNGVCHFEHLFALSRGMNATTPKSTGFTCRNPYSEGYRKLWDQYLQVLEDRDLPYMITDHGVLILT